MRDFRHAHTTRIDPPRPQSGYRVSGEMPALRRLTAWLIAAVLLLQSLQANAMRCALSHATAERVDGKPTVAHADVGSEHDHLAGANAASHAARHVAVGWTSAPSPTDRGHHDGCPDSSVPTSCSAMTTCSVSTALPTVSVNETTARSAQLVISTRVGRPPTSVRAPEIPPPRA